MSIELEDRLRAAFDHRAASTTLSTASEQPTPWPVELDRDPLRAWRARGPVRALSVAAALVIVIAALVVVAAVRHRPASPTDTPAGRPTVVTDARDISLDAFRSLTDDGAAQQSRFVVLDTAALPAGWAASESGFTRLASAGGGYLYTASVVTGAGEQYQVHVASGDPPMYPAKPADGSGDVGGAPVAAVGPGAIQWSPSDDTTISLESTSTTSASDLIGIAARLQFTVSARLPQTAPESSPSYEPSNDSIQFGGSLAGSRWTARVSPSVFRSMSIRVGGHPTSAFGNDRLSQPDDTPATTVEATIDGSPGLGVIVYGYAPPAAATLRAVLAGGQVVDVPMYRRELESFFAIPIPDGVVVDSLVLVDAGGQVIAQGALPQIPRQLGGTYGGAGVFTMTDTIG